MIFLRGGEGKGAGVEWLVFGLAYLVFLIVYFVFSFIIFSQVSQSDMCGYQLDTFYLAGYI